MCSWGNEMSVAMVVARNVNHASHELPWTAWIVGPF